MRSGPGQQPRLRHLHDGVSCTAIRIAGDLRRVRENRIDPRERNGRSRGLRLRRKTLRPWTEARAFEGVLRAACSLAAFAPRARHRTGCLVQYRARAIRRVTMHRLGPRNNHRRFVLAAAIFIAALVASGAAGVHAAAAAKCKPLHPKINDYLIKAGTLTTIGEELPPWYTITNGKLSGYDGDLMVAIAGLECLKLNAKEVDAVGVIPTIASNRADIGGGNWYRTLTHAKVVYYTNPTHTDRMAIVSKDGVDTIDGLQGRKIGNLLGDTWTADVTAILGSSNVINYPSNQAIYQDMSAGRLDTSLFAYNGTSWYMHQP